MNEFLVKLLNISYCKIAASQTSCRQSLEQSLALLYSRAVASIYGDPVIQIDFRYACT